jgi:DNA-binding transcriptional ArsR family regulator
VLLYEQPGVADPALYFSVLGAIADGAAKRSEIAGVLGKSDSALNHPLAALQELRLIAKVEDALRSKRPIYQLTEPVIRFQQLVIRPREATLAARGGLRVWRDCADTVTSKIYGPHLEDMAREWVLTHADVESLGGWVNQVRPATIACRVHKAGHELDVVALSDLPYEPVRVRAIGEVKATEKPVGDGELTRLEHLRELLPPDRVNGRVKLLLFARNGFTKELERTSAGRDDVELIDLHRLYDGA